MKLLIDIPEHIYEHAKEGSEDSRDEGEAMRAIANGSPARCKGMDEAEKERLIKKNMLSIENRVRHVFNQGYEMGVKKNKPEIPTSCGDAISRQAVLEKAINVPIAKVVTEDKVIYRKIVFVDDIENLPSVSPQQRTGRWIFDEILDKHYYCSECKSMGVNYWDFCPNCGAKMVEQQESEG